jgi:hypothetical protein
MADTITYPGGGYGIMPNDAFNKYIKFQNQRRATTGGGASASDQQAFWTGTMDAVVKNSAQRAMQNLENRRLDADISYKNSMLGLEGRKIDQADDTRKSQMLSGLAQYPMTYLMYDALGVGRRNPVTGATEGSSLLGDVGGFLKESIWSPVKKRLFEGGIPNNPSQSAPLQFANNQSLSSGVQGMEGGGIPGIDRMSDSPGGGYEEYLQNFYLPSGGGDAINLLNTDKTDSLGLTDIFDFSDVDSIDWSGAAGDIWFI